MPTFQVGINKEDIQQPSLLPEDWYTVEIFKEPTEAKNNAWKDVGENLSIEEAGKIDKKAGKYIYIPLKVVSDTPEQAGRMLVKRLSLPSVLDEGEFTNQGQPKADWKADIIFKWVEAFGGSIAGGEASLAKGQRAQVYVIIGKDQSGEKDQNDISMNVNPRPIGGGVEAPLGKL